MDERIRVYVSDLEDFVVEVLKKHGMDETDARICTAVMTSADKRGIESHGVARLKRYVDGIKNGVIRLDAEVQTVQETPVSLVIDGGGGMGQLIGHSAMKRCIEKAKESFICFAAIRNSNHYGIAGYYSQMALDEGMIGLSLTNSAPLVVPTFGKDAILGTNPISMGVPSNGGMPFLLDMATSTVPRGKVEVFSRKDQSMPPTWATDEHGEPTTDPKLVLDNLVNRNGGGLLPIGGNSMLNAGHKGYSLAMLVDIFCGVLSGGAVGLDVNKNKNAPANVAHFLGAINPAAFTGLEAIGERMGYLGDMLKNSRKCCQEDRIYIPGEVEYEAEEANRESLTLQDKVFGILNDIGHEFNLKLNKGE